MRTFIALLFIVASSPVLAGSAFLGGMGQGMQMNQLAEACSAGDMLACLALRDLRNKEEMTTHPKGLSDPDMQDMQQKLDHIYNCQRFGLCY